MAGPGFPLKKGETHVSPGNSTKHALLPLGLKALNASEFDFPLIPQEDKEAKECLDAFVSLVPPNPSTLHKESDVLRATAPFFSNVLEIIAPIVLRLRDALEWSSEYTSGKAGVDQTRNDTLIRLRNPSQAGTTQGQATRGAGTEQSGAMDMQKVAVLEYKVSLPPPKARKIALPHQEDAERKLDEITPKMHLSKKSTFDLVKEDTKNLIKQGVNYGRKTRFIMIYDYTTLLLMHVPPGNLSDKLVNIYICQEPQKDKYTAPPITWTNENHVQLALKWILKAVQSLEATPPTAGGAGNGGGGGNGDRPRERSPTQERRSQPQVASRYHLRSGIRGFLAKIPSPKKKSPRKG
ncbi:MAG: hypothetical protein Q9162_007547 [Coniocarpon cinnabarinum]